MSVRGNLGSPAIVVGVADTVIYQPTLPVERVAVSALNVFNTGATNVIQFFVSPDLTSAAGTLIAEVKVGTNKTVDVSAIIGQGYEVGENIIAQASIAGSSASITVTEYDGGS